MTNLNTMFQEEYKRLDRLLCDAYETRKGVTSYLECMESYGERIRFRISGWAEDYQTLKRLRHVRNNMSHEVGTLWTENCTVQDIYWLVDFRQRILTARDPVAMAEKMQRNSIPSQPKPVSNPHGNMSYAYASFSNEEQHSDSDTSRWWIPAIICVVTVVFVLAFLILMR